VKSPVGVEKVFPEVRLGKVQKCKLLILSSTNITKVAEITVLIRFSTTTPVYIN